ncbi:MAG: PD40 domain-containing protein [Acidobacteria bacterium]|nr:PD40 domain-containing protein [Acidobacteriota bacterium]
MKRGILVISLVAVLPVRPDAQVRLNGIWQAEVQSNGFWTIELRSEGTNLTGAVSMGTDPVEITDGRVEGNIVSFVVETPDGDRTLRFNGTVTGEAIAFTREVQVRQGGFVGLSDIFGVKAPNTFTLTRLRDGERPRTGRGTFFPAQLTIFDRSGKVMRTLGEQDNYFAPVFSPDGTRLVTVLRSDLWIFDVARGTRMRLTATPRFEFAPVWSSDGRYVAYSTFYRNITRLYRRLADGTGTEELLYENMPGVGMNLQDWSADGRWLLFASGGVLFTLPLDGNRHPIELAREEFTMNGARFSPDQRFLAFRSDESGRWEIVVRALDPASGFSPDGGKWQVSQGGLGLAQWRRDGRELLYLASDGRLMAVEVSTTPAFKAGPPRPLFRFPENFPLIFGPGGLGGISHDGQRIAVAVLQPPPRKETVVPLEILSKYAGTYQLFGSEARMMVEGNQLVARMFNERIPLLAQSETSFFSRIFSGEIDFVTGADGAVTHFLFYQGGPAVTAQRK